MPIASPLRRTCSHNCSPEGGAHFRYWPAPASIVSARSATRLASAARSSGDETVNPIAENWLGKTVVYQPDFSVRAGKIERHEDAVRVERVADERRALDKAVT